VSQAPILGLEIPYSGEVLEFTAEIPCVALSKIFSTDCFNVLKGKVPDANLFAVDEIGKMVLILFAPLLFFGFGGTGGGVRCGCIMLCVTT
jgi:hypothetical protein